jgi:hypothetical protein
MKHIKKLIIIAPVLLAVVTPGSGSSTLLHTCQSCIQIPPPTVACDSVSEIVTFCGSESWINNGVSDCKRFMTHTRYCVKGGTQTWTECEWSGVGSNCRNDGTEHDCY